MVGTIHMENNLVASKYDGAEWLDMESPFAYHEGEVLVDEPAAEFGHYIELNEFQTVIVKLVNRMLFSTKELIKKYLIRLGMEFSEKELAKELKNLSMNHYLCKKSFMNEDGSKSCLKVYVLGRKGKGFLKHNRTRINLEGYVLNRTASQVKKILVANQAMLELAKMDQDMYFETSKMLLAKQNYNCGNKLFRALGYMNHSKAGKSYIIQPVRNEQDNVDELLDKLHRMELVIKKCGTSGLKLADELTIVIVAENKVWMEYFENIIQKQHYAHLKIAVTYDRLLISDNVLENKLIPVKTASLLQKLLKIA